MALESPGELPQRARAPARAVAPAAPDEAPASSAEFRLRRERDGESVDMEISFRSLAKAAAHVDKMEADGTWPEGWDAVCSDIADQTWVYDEGDNPHGWSLY